MSDNVYYIYCGEQGEFLFRVVRTPDKKFFQERFENGNWVMGLGSTPRVLYNLPGLIADQEKIVCIVEGEKDCGTLSSYGMLATTNSGGCGGSKWLDSYNPYFKDRKVVIFPDNDEVGRKHAVDVAQDLSSVTSKIKIVYLPGLPPKGDVTDWMATHDKNDLLKEMANATTFRPLPQKEAIQKRSQQDSTRNIFFEIKRTVSLDQEIRKYTDVVRTDPGGSNWSHCPFHDENTPSFKWEEDRYICFGCGVQGDVIDFYALKNNISQGQAVQELTVRCGPNLEAELANTIKAQSWQRRIIFDLAFQWRSLTNVCIQMKGAATEIAKNPWASPINAGPRKVYDDAKLSRDRIVMEITAGLDDLQKLCYTGTLILGGFSQEHIMDVFFTDYASKPVEYQKKRLKAFVTRSEFQDIFAGCANTKG